MGAYTIHEDGSIERDNVLYPNREALRAAEGLSKQALSYRLRSGWPNRIGRPPKWVNFVLEGRVHRNVREAAITLGRSEKRVYELLQERGVRASATNIGE